MRKRSLCYALLIVFAILCFGCGTKSTKKAIPETFMITAKNYFDHQGVNECSGYASAYVLRSLGADIDGSTLYDKIDEKNSDGTVWPDPLVKAIKNEGYDANYYIDSNLDDLKQLISKGVPIIVLVSVDQGSSMSHYLPVVGYDEDYFYFADSLAYKANEVTEYYNRKESYEDFEKLWDAKEAHNFVMIISK